jgi:hypothetical protein
MSGYSKTIYMEGNYLTAGELALFDQRRGWGYGDGCGYGYGHKNGMAATGIGLAAGLGGAALLGVLAIGWGVNQASKARSRGAEQANTLLANNMVQLSNLAIANKQASDAALYNERVSRESWQNYHAPSTTQYVDVRSGAFSGAGSNAWAQAEAQIVSNALTGRMQTCPTPVALYSAPQPCGCPNSCNG